ncbi:MAG: hypothetical protein OEX97_00820 [Acidimicrobiia bacterium]|nr:hypothetical protein [Acidimicrobiia bacterium]
MVVEVKDVGGATVDDEAVVDVLVVAGVNGATVVTGVAEPVDDPPISPPPQAAATTATAIAGISRRLTIAPSRADRRSAGNTSCQAGRSGRAPMSSMARHYSPVLGCP